MISCYLNNNPMKCMVAPRVLWTVEWYMSVVGRGVALSYLAFGTGQIHTILGCLSDFPSHSFVSLCIPSCSFTFYHAPIMIPSHIFTLPLYTLGISLHILATASFSFLLSLLHFLSHPFTFLGLPSCSFAFLAFLSLGFAWLV